MLCLCGAFLYLMVRWIEAFLRRAHKLALPPLPCILWTESGDSLGFNCIRNSAYTRPVYCPFYCIRFGSMDTSAGRLTEAWGFPHALPAYDSLDTLAWLHQKYRSRWHYQPALYQGHHNQEAKLTVGHVVRLDHHTPAHRALSQVAAIRTMAELVDSTNRRQHTFCYSRRVDQGLPSWTHRDWVDATDLCRLCDLMMMMMMMMTMNTACPENFSLLTNCYMLLRC